MNSWLVVALAATVIAHVAPREDDPTATPKTLVSADTYAELAHYAAFADSAAILAVAPCPNPPFGTVLQDYYNINLTSTQAALYRDDAKKEFILAFPGSNSTIDDITDLSLVLVPYVSPGVECQPSCLVHLGFLDAWNSAADGIQSSLAGFLQQYPGFTTTVTGASLGGALSQLAYASLKASGSFRVTKGFSYGQPRTGDPAYANYIDQISGAAGIAPGIFHRVTHANDPVPGLIPELLGYRHSRTEYWEETLTPALATTYRCYGQEPADCIDSIGLDVNIAAHSTYAGLQYEGCNATAT